MHRDSDRQKLFTRRALMLAGGKFVLLSALGLRLYYLQVMQADKYKTLADENRINLRLLPPPRGTIVDRHGVPLAINSQNYRVLLVSEQAEDVEATLAGLGSVIDIGEKERRRVLREVHRRRGFVPVTVRENLSWEDVARIEVNAPDLPGVFIDVGQTRYYPNGSALAHVLGYVSSVSEKDLTGDPLLELPGFRIGKAGIEKVYDLPLRGKGGNSQVEVNAFGRVIRELDRQEGQPGAEIPLNIDLDLQKYCMQRVEEESAAVVVLDANNGEVLALASSPTFDPNSFNTGLGVDEWRSLISNPKAPLIDKVIGGQYPPGSTFKMAIALAALEKGSITPQTRVFCPGHMELGNATFHCWKRRGHGAMNMETAIAESCDVYFYEIARRTGIDAIANMARRLGFGMRLGIDLPGERPGLVPTKEWKLATVGVPWQQGETIQIGIGQGYLLATPLQLAVSTARIVNGGFAVEPRIARNVVTPDGMVSRPEQRFPSIDVSARSLNLVRKAMARVVNHPTGTAYRSRIEEKGFEMGGKTGTAQVRRITQAEREQGVRKNNELDWEERDHALFVGFAPLDNPRYVVSVLIEHGGGGSSVAAPVARDVLLAAQHLDASRPVKEVEPVPARRGEDV